MLYIGEGLLSFESETCPDFIKNTLEMEVQQRSGEEYKSLSNT